MYETKKIEPLPTVVGSKKKSKKQELVYTNKWESFGIVKVSVVTTLP